MNSIFHLDFGLAPADKFVAPWIMVDIRDMVPFPVELFSDKNTYYKINVTYFVDYT